MKPEEIVQRVSKLYKKQLENAKKTGFHHPAFYESTKEIKSLILLFEKETGLDWDKDARRFLK